VPKLKYKASLSAMQFALEKKPTGRGMRKQTDSALTL